MAQWLLPPYASGGEMVIACYLIRYFFKKERRSR